MCRDIHKIDVRRSLQRNKSSRSWRYIVTRCKQHGYLTTWAHQKDGSQGQYRTHNADCWTRMETNLWPEELRDIVVCGLDHLKKQRPAKPKPSRREQNAVKARTMLATWQRRAKLAAGKVKKYAAQVRRYERLATTKDSVLS